MDNYNIDVLQAVKNYIYEQLNSDEISEQNKKFYSELDQEDLEALSIETINRIRYDEIVESYVEKSIHNKIVNKINSQYENSKHL